MKNNGERCDTECRQAKAFETYRPARHGLASEAALHTFALTYRLPLLNRHEFSPDRLAHILA